LENWENVDGFGYIGFLVFGQKLRVDDWRGKGENGENGEKEGERLTYEGVFVGGLKHCGEGRSGIGI
jgi:hypothetical protein